MNYKTSIGQVAQYAEELLGKKTIRGLSYHNIKHTKGVAAFAKKLVVHYQLSDQQSFVVIAAAWLHDIGYAKGADEHESESIAVATQYLQRIGIDQQVITMICACIAATRLPQEPKDQLEEIMCDSDLFHLGKRKFPDYNEALRKERNAASNLKVTKADWRRQTILFLQNHHYFTDQCKILLDEKKAFNLEKLIDKEWNSAMKPADDKPEVIENKETAAKKKRDETPERGIDTMLRIASNNNQRLLSRADGKAHILITVNSIILSAIVSLVIRRLETESFLIIPTFLLLFVSLGSIIISIISTRPKFATGAFSIDDIDGKAVDMLFFGSHLEMKLPHYIEIMNGIMTERPLIYRMILTDMYAQGAALGRKYKQLKIAYNFFMVGLILSVIAFFLAVMLHVGTVNNPIPTNRADTSTIKKP